MPATSNASPYSARLRARYFPPLQVNRATVAWLCVYDWTITDSERRQLLRWAFHDTYAAGTTGVNSFIRDLNGAWPTVYASLGGVRAVKHRPCSDCGAMTLACPDCDACPNPACAQHEANRTYHPKCGHCSNCCAACSNCEGCSNCGSCDCSHCERCGEAFESTCSNCNNCNRHCGCGTCDNCGASVDSWHCSECERCEDCGCNCDSDDDETDGESQSVRASGRTWPVTLVAHRTKFSSPRMAGLEVEYNACDDFSPIRAWCKTWGASVHSDGSCGWECVTSPAAGNHLLSQIGDLTDALSESSARHKEDCGVHVHVDASDLRWPDMARIVRLYERVEPALYVLAGRRRWSNHYCRPWDTRFTTTLASTTDVKGAILRVLYNSADEAAGKKELTNTWSRDDGNGKLVPYGEPEKKSSFRYHGLNLAPWIARLRRRNKSKDARSLYNRPVSDATVEFRLHENCHDRERLTAWTKLLVRLVDFASKSTDSEIDALPRSGMRALATIAPDCLPFIVKRTKAYRNAVNTGNRFFRYSPSRGWYAEGAKAGSKAWGIAPVTSENTHEKWICTKLDGIALYGFATRDDAERYVQTVGRAGYAPCEVIAAPDNERTPLAYRYGLYSEASDCWLRSLYHDASIAALAAPEGYAPKLTDYSDVPELDRWIVESVTYPEGGPQPMLTCYNDRSEFGAHVQQGSKAWAMYWQKRYPSRYLARPLHIQLPLPLTDVGCELPPGYVKPRDRYDIRVGDTVQIVWRDSTHNGRRGTVTSVDNRYYEVLYSDGQTSNWYHETRSPALERVETEESTSCAA